ncbi:MAG: AMMECR1 domain-containing protein, partial [Candidatus Micrarchaeota archaeon]
MSADYSPNEKKYMLSLARASMELYVKFGKVLKIDTGDAPKSLLEERACFVSLHGNSGLRGCIGSLQAFRPLVEDISANAIASATQDPRFPPV